MALNTMPILDSPQGYLARCRAFCAAHLHCLEQYIWLALSRENHLAHFPQLTGTNSLSISPPATRAERMADACASVMQPISAIFSIRLPIPILNSLLNRPTGKSYGAGDYGWLARCFKAAFPSANPALGIAEDSGGSGLGEVVTEPPVAERGGGHLATRPVFDGSIIKISQPLCFFVRGLDINAELFTHD